MSNFSNQLSKIQFAPTLEDEVTALATELQLGQLISHLENGQEITQPVRDQLLKLLKKMQDFFNIDFPAVETDLLSAIIKSGREMAVSRLLRERSLFRLYVVIQSTDGYSAPEYLSKINPDTGEPFKNQEELLGWFCKEAHVSRSLVFLRMKIIRRLLDLGINLQLAYQLCLTKFTAVRETLDLVADWEHDKVLSVDPQIMEQLTISLADSLSDNQVQEVKRLTALAETQDFNQNDLTDAAKPVLCQLFQQVADHGSVQDARDYVRHDILAHPEVSYRWDTATQSLLVDYIQKAVDPQGTEYITNISTYAFTASTPEILPPEIVQDLITRLPIRNRRFLDK